MSAEVLRRAAGLMRERAAAATPTPWVVKRVSPKMPAYVAHEGWWVIASRTEQWDAEHIASWHPAVALAVADWLDAAYADWHYSEHSLGAMSVRAMSGRSNLPDGMALAVARAYLGESA